MIAGIPGRWLGLALVLAGLGAVLLSTGFEGEWSLRVARADIPVNTGARDPANIDANNSPTITRNPRRPDQLAVVNRVDTPRYRCGLNVSADGGERWLPVGIPIPRGEEDKCFAPDAAFAADGTLYVLYVTLRGRGNVPHAAWLVRSGDGGRTLSAPRRVLGPLAFQARLAADPGRPRRLYVTWLQAADVGLYRFTAPGNPIHVMRSDDGGASWGRPVRVSDPTRGRVVGPSPVVGPHGELYVLFLDLRDDRLDYEGAHEGFGGPPYAGRFALVLGRSRDAGATWAESVVEPRLVPTRRFLSFLPPFPSLAVDRRDGRIYAGMEDGRLGRSDVYVWTLAPGAGRWSTATRVNDTPPRDGTTQSLAKLAVAPDGRLDVLYMDRRADARDRRAEISLQSSSDAGRSFTRHLVLTDRSFDTRVGAGSERGLPDLGSRLGLESTATQAQAVWTDTRAGTEVSNKQDIAFVPVSVSRAARMARPLRLGLRGGGVIIALAGLGLLAFILGARRT